MLEARRLVAERGSSLDSGTVVQAGFQASGRGRMKDRQWESKPGDGLLFTIVFTSRDLQRRMNGAPFTILPLLCGLAVAEAVDDYLLQEAPLSGRAQPAVTIKWPNDVLADGGKLCGILCESSGGYVYAGIGVNMNQAEFAEGLRRPASSLRLITGRSPDSDLLLGMILDKMSTVPGYKDWRERIESRLYRLRENVRMIPGIDEPAVDGILYGISRDGAVLIEHDGEILLFYSGELKV